MLGLVVNYRCAELNVRVDSSGKETDAGFGVLMDCSLEGVSGSIAGRTLLSPWRPVQMHAIAISFIFSRPATPY